MFSLEKARALLKAANVFFPYEGEGTAWPDRQTLNLNDVWGWACSDGEEVPDDALIEVATLFWRYGWPGILYWVSERRGGCRSEFLDNNRFIDFVKREEQLRREVPDSSDRAYHQLTYTLGASGREAGVRGA